MQSSSAEHIVIRDYPVALWIIGAVLTLGGVVWELAFLALQPGGFWPAGRELARPGNLYSMIITGGLLPGAIMFLVGAPMALLTSSLSVTADRLSGKLTLRYWSLIRSSLKEYPLSQIASVDVDTSRSSSNGSTSTTYRMMLRLASGERVPLRSYYSSGYREKESKARRLREFLGTPELTPRPATAFEAVRQLTHPSFTPGQAGTTQGVAWRLENASFGGVPVSRWCSADFKLPASFVCLMQRPPDPKAAQVGGGLGAKVSQVLYRQVLSMYGINPGALPGYDTALAIEALDARLAPSFVSLTNDQASARQCLNPWALMPLAQWAEAHSMTNIQHAGQAGQLIVLFSPEGVALTWLNAIAPEQVEALTGLGVELVRAQGAA